ncbi:hypothetical protein AGMMS49982_09150 [Bacteroidia bacterium]|nr:hypothetical protein AGMMS49982_09150 [Bacteroidia bacterium]
MKNLKFMVFFLLPAVLGMTACAEEERYKGGATDSDAPGQVTIDSVKPLYGGARFYFTPPTNEDLLKIDAEYTNAEGKTFLFTASYFAHSIEVYGFSDVSPRKVRLYAVDRSNNRSAATEREVTPDEPAFTRVAASIVVKPGFSSFFMDWENELTQNVNVYVNFSYTHEGTKREFTSVFSSNLPTDRKFINDLPLTPAELVSVSVQVEDLYGNKTAPIDKGQISLNEDAKLPKNIWTLPEPAEQVGTDVIDGVPYPVLQVSGNHYEGKLRYVYDDIINRGDNLNFIHTGGAGKTGIASDGNVPWNLIIDLGDYYELSRIVTVQRHSGGLQNVERGQYYRDENVGLYNMYTWNDTTSTWERIGTESTKIPIPPSNIDELQYVKLGEAGDMAYMYPDDPKYTKRTRKFRYEALKSFDGDYTSESADCLSEITLYGRKAPN